MSKKTWIIFIVAVVAILTGMVIYSRNSNPQIDVSTIDTNSIIVASDLNGNIADHVYGQPNSKVILIEYGDFQCPGCFNAHPRIKAIVEEYKDQISFVFRNFPLTTLHPNARAAAGAAEAGGLQDKYWEMHDSIFENQASWKSLSGTERTDAFTNFATSIGLDITKFTADISSAAINQKIVFDQALGKKAEVNSTPTFILNGTTLENTVWGDDTALKAAIDAELTKAGIPLPSATTN